MTVYVYAYASCLAGTLLIHARVYACCMRAEESYRCDNTYSSMEQYSTLDNQRYLRIVRSTLYNRILAPAFSLPKLQPTACRSVEDCCWEKRTHCSQVVFRLRWSLYRSFSTRVLHTRI